MAAPTSNSEGSQTCIISTEHTLGTITEAGFYELQLDLNNLASGDTLIARVKIKVRSTGTTRLQKSVTYSDAQTDFVVTTLPVSALNEVVYTIEQTAGTGRAIPWEIVSL